tara:strand:+ start:3517 stop:3837 length:321 start_codon:yes stop_codon:yes gene_type:complete
MTFGFFLVAAFFEIAGCYAFWGWWKLDKNPLWLIPAVISLVSFAWILAQVEASYAGRAYAAYGGVYIAASFYYGGLLWKNSYPMVTIYWVSHSVSWARLSFFSARR